jgi:electron transport complex protein RnfG
MREMISMIVVLTVLTSVSGFLLAAVQSGTKVRIEEQVLKIVQAPAIEEIFPDVSNDPIAERFPIVSGDISLKIFPAKLTDGSNAIAFETKGKGGYGGNVGFMVGINLENDQIIAARVTTHSETPGFGARAKDDPDFVSQFAEKSIDDTMSLKSAGGSIDAMSGATVTSTALALAATEAQKLYKQLKPEILKQIK